MASIGSLTVDLALQSAQFINGMRQAAAQSQATSRAINSAMNTAKGAVAGFVGVMSVDFLAGATQRAFDYADSIQDLADRTSNSTKFIQEFGYAAQLTGSSVESAGTGLEKFTKLVGEAANGSESARKTLAAYGVTSYEADVAVRQAADGIAKLDTRQAQAAATTTLFGKKALDLTQLMAGGSQAINRFAAEAEELGIVLGDDLIANAGQVNDKLDTLKMILSAQFASTIVQNADAIGSMATSVMQLAGALVQFWGSNPAAAMGIMGALAGGAVGGLPGAAIGGVGGYVAGGQMQNQTLYGQNKSWKRYKDIEDRASAALTKSGWGDGLINVGRPSAAQQRLINVRNDMQTKRQRLEAGLQDGSIVNRRPTVPTGAGGVLGGGGTIELPTAKGGGARKKSGGGGGAIERLLSEGELTEQWRSMLYPSQRELRESAANLSRDPAERFRSERQTMSDETGLAINRLTNDTGTEAEVKSGKKRITEAQAEILKQNLREVYQNNYDASVRDEAQAIKDQQLDLSRSMLGNDLQLMQAEASLLTSSRDRREAALRIVDQTYKLEKITLDGIVASTTATQAEKDIAKARLAILDRLKAADVKAAKEQTRGPLEEYLKGASGLGYDINDELQRVQVDGLISLEDGLMGVIDGTKSVSEAFKGMASSIIQQLIRIAIQQAIIKPIAEALFGSSQGGQGGQSTGGFLGQILGAVIKSTATKGGRANGGMTQPGDYHVGERGPEIVRIGSPANVMSNDALRRVASNDNRRGGLTVSIGNITSNDPAMVRQMVFEGVAQAMPLNAEQSSNSTLAKLKRRRM